MTGYHSEKQAALWAVGERCSDNQWPVHSMKAAYSIAMQMNIDIAVNIQSFDNENYPAMWCSPQKWHGDEKSHKSQMKKNGSAWPNWEF